MYVDAIHNRRTDTIQVVERQNGLRVYKTIPCNYTFYFTSAAGKYTSIFGDKLAKYTTSDYKKFTREKAIRARTSHIFESDINPIFRCLEENYLNAETPELVLGFFDLESDFCDKRGFAPVENPFNPITAISIFNTKKQQMDTIVVAPPTLTDMQAQDIVDKYENTTLCEDEAQLLNLFLDLIEDIDVLSGWNSTGYDIPYIVGRIERTLGKEHLKRLCLWEQMPRKREYEKFKKTSITYDLVGRVHLDYLELYQKHNPQQLHSYRLDFVGEIEVGENKTAYSGTLDDLYKKDFSLFIEYNRQDTMLLVKIDRKKRFIELANQIAHTNTVLLKTSMGSVALIEQAITNEAHSRGMIVPDRKEETDELDYADLEDEYDSFYEDEEPREQIGAVGAYVADPKIGISKMVGSVDINSLYPSVLRALGMSPETLVGHIRPTYTDKMLNDKIKSGMKSNLLWEGVFNTVEFDFVHGKTLDSLEVDFVDGSMMTMTAEQLYDMIYKPDSNLVLTANGTIFRTDVEGVIPSLLTRWYAERKIMQTRKSIYNDLYYGGLDLDGWDIE